MGAPAATFEVYDPNRATGDLSPTAAKPPKKQGGCGGLGGMLLAVVAVAVTIVVAPWATGIIAGQAAAGSAAAIGGAVLGGAIAGAAGSIASQALGLATGLQDEFSWKAVGMAAIGGGVGSGLGAAFPGGGMLGAVARGAAGSAISQGIGIAAGLQRKFDWAGVAAAGVIGGISHALGNTLPSLKDNNSLANHLRHSGVGAASAIAGAAARSLATGTSFGDNILAVLPDVIGSTLGNMISRGVSRGGAGENWINEAALQRAVGQAFALPDMGTALVAAGTTAATATHPIPGVNGGKVDASISSKEARNLIYGGLAIEGGAAVTINSTYRDGTVAISGGKADGPLTLSGYINSIGLSGGTDLLGTHFFDNNPGIYFGDVDVFRDRIAFETVHNDRMLDANIAFLTAANEARFDPYIQALREVHDFRWENGGRQATARADRAAWDVASAGLGADALTAGYRMANGEVNWTNGITLAASLVGPLAAGAKIVAKGVKAANTALPAIGGHIPNAGGVIRQFIQQGDQVYYRVFSGNSRVGSFLTAVPPQSSAYAREALALPPGNQATFIQEVLVPNATPILRSRALPQPAWGRTRGGAEQFELLKHIPIKNFGPGRLLP